ncbi:MAG: 50S ribosomal protein L19e [Conexivisphaerales archaeon]
MNLASKKRLAASMLKAGISRVRFSDEALDRIADAVTRDDIRKLIRAGDIWVAQSKGISSGRKRKVREKKSFRGRGPGSKEGKATARNPKKRQWLSQVRALRRYIKFLKKKGQLPDEEIKRLYTKVKGGEIKTVRRLKEIVVEMKGAR